MKCVWTPSSVRSATDPSGFTSPEKEFVVETTICRPVSTALALVICHCCGVWAVSIKDELLDWTARIFAP